VSKLLAYARSNAIAVIALLIALGGTSYAAVAIPAGSVGTRQLKNHSVTPVKFDRSEIGGYVRYWAQISPSGTLVSSRPRAHLVGWQTAPTAAISGGLVGWGRAIPAGCFAMATTVPNPPSHFESYASALLQGTGGKGGPYAGAYVYMSAPRTGVNVAVICPQP